MYSYRCGACGHIARTFPSDWDDEQRRNYWYCPECGEYEKIERLLDGRGTHLHNLPADAMDQLMKQLPSGWFFPRKKASEGWQNKVAKGDAVEDVKRLKQIAQAMERDGRLKGITRNIMKHLGLDKDQEDDQCQDPRTQ